MSKNKSIIQVAGRIMNTPLLIHADTLNTILGLINQHGGLHISVPGKEAALQTARPGAGLNSAPQDALAVIPVHGVLSYRADELMEWFFGDTSYEAIRESFRAAVSDPAVKAIVLDVDSPGGEVSGCFDLVDEIYQARGTKPIYAVVNETAFSAAYAIASAAETVYLSRTAGAGSIGVITVHLDQSKFDEQQGAKYTVIHTGARKADFNSHTPLSPEAQAIAQSMVNDAYEIFVKTVARNRGMTSQAVRDTEAGLYFGKKAVESGLADAVMPWTKALDTIKKNQQAVKGGTSMKSFLEKIQALFAEQSDRAAAESGLTAILAEAGYILKPAAGTAGTGAESNLSPEALLELEPVKTKIAASVAEALASMKANVIAILEVCALADMNKLAIGFITAGTSLEDARTKVMADKAGASGRTHIRSTVAALSTGEPNPLVVDAKERAEAANKK